MTDLETLVTRPPTAQRWAEIVAHLDRLDGGARIEAIDAARPVLAWPARLRALDANSPWLAGIFDEGFDRTADPRLALAGWASIKNKYEYGYTTCNMHSGQMIHIVAGFAKRLDPAFDPPNVVLDKGRRDLLRERVRRGAGVGEAGRRRSRGRVPRSRGRTFGGHVQ